VSSSDFWPTLMYSSQIKTGLRTQDWSPSIARRCAMVLSQAYARAPATDYPTARRSDAQQSGWGVRLYIVASLDGHGASVGRELVKFIGQKSED
jgi:hypothetical protein